MQEELYRTKSCVVQRGSCVDTGRHVALKTVRKRSFLEMIQLRAEAKALEHLSAAVAMNSTAAMTTGDGSNVASTGAMFRCNVMDFIELLDEDIVEGSVEEVSVEGGDCTLVTSFANAGAITQTVPSLL